MRIKKDYIGKWRLTEMEQWDKDYIDLMGTGHLISFHPEIRISGWKHLDFHMRLSPETLF
jgi:hypothetical protein